MDALLPGWRPRLDAVVCSLIELGAYTPIPVDALCPDHVLAPKVVTGCECTTCTARRRRGDAEAEMPSPKQWQRIRSRAAAQRFLVERRRHEAARTQPGLSQDSEISLSHTQRPSRAPRDIT